MGFSCVGFPFGGFSSCVFVFGDAPLRSCSFGDCILWMFHCWRGLFGAHLGGCIWGLFFKLAEFSNLETCLFGNVLNITFFLNLSIWKYACLENHLLK